jgi:hypothetical protein
MNRAITFVLLAVLFAAGSGRAAGSNAPSLDARLEGYPELTMRVTEETIEAPARVAAGRALVVQQNDSTETAHFFIARIPDDVTEDRLGADLAIERVTAADQTPEWLFRSTFVGNPDRAAPGSRSVALVEFAAGRYVVMDPLRPAKYDRFEVVGDAAAVSEPEADVVAEMYEMAFALPSAVPAGPQVWRVHNTGAALHEIALMPVPADATADQAMDAIAAALRAEAAGEPFEGQPAPPDLGPVWADWRLELVNGVGASSPGRAVLAHFDLEPGTYAAVCFVPSGDGVPHLMAGMVQVFVTTAPAARH